MKIGEFARCAEVRIDTVRYYERQGLLPVPARQASGYRRYDQSDVARLLFVLSLRGEMWKKMLLGNPKLNITCNKQFVEKSSPVKDGDEIALVGFSMV